MTTAKQIIAEALSWQGTPYHHQASCKGAGTDCLGLVLGVYRACIGPLAEAVPPYTPDWAEAAGRETLAEAARRHLLEIPPADAQPGDVLLFRWRPRYPAKHCAILTAPGRIVQAYDGVLVGEVPLGPHWSAMIAYAFRFPGV
jgi:NlpC/P60 family putative phage cell wall peptidase